MARQSAGDLAKAKAAKQKKIAIGGSVLLVALLAFQVPRTLKMMHPPQAASASSSSATPTTPADTTAAPVAPAADPAAATPSTAPPATGTSTGTAGQMVLTAELSPAPREGQLAVFTSTFTTKDPFKPQADDVKTSSTDTASGAGTAKDGGTTGATPTTGSSGSAAPAAPAAPAGALVSATISINGVEEGVNLDADFPAATPLFHLVSLTAKTAKISIAGGSLATGAPAITLTRGKTVTLMNTADGTRYQITLVATSTVPAVAPAATAAPAAAVAAPSTSSTTSTTASTP